MLSFRRGQRLWISSWIALFVAGACAAISTPAFAVDPAPTAAPATLDAPLGAVVGATPGAAVEAADSMSASPAKEIPTSEALPDTYPVKGSPAPTATPLETIPVASPRATSAPTPTPTPTPTPGKDAHSRVQAACKDVYPANYQDKLRVQCADGAEQAMKTGWANAASQCRAKHNIGERLQMICQVGATIGDELKQNKTAYVQRAAVCRELFPVTSPVDVYFQESCLSGTDLQAHSSGRASLGQCHSLSPNDRGFLAPCASGMALVASLGEGQSTTAADLNKLCSQYFDKAAFNLGYRSCLSALSLSLESGDRKFDVVHRCGDVSDTKNANERASCVVGYELYRYLHKPDQLAKRFHNCGATKVTYDERDTLACLTASSLTDFMDRGKARKACKDIFTGKKNHSLADCERML